jgi:ribosomal protein L6P/L9E
MSRIGKLPVNVPQNVNIELTGQEIKVKGPHGSYYIQYQVKSKFR